MKKLLNFLANLFKTKTNFCIHNWVEFYNFEDPISGEITVFSRCSKCDEENIRIFTG